MKVSIVTVVFNGEKTIRDTVQSVVSQDYKNFEYIVVDGDSTDNTVQVVRSFKGRVNRIISEKDHGIYDAMNKGVLNATGDVIGFLNSDDFYINNKVISLIADQFQNKKVDAVFGDVVYVKPENLDKIVRYYSAKNFSPDQMAWGRYPPHPAFFMKRYLFEKYGLFKTDYVIAADIELMIRLMVKHRISYSYIPKVCVKMRTGGISTKNLKSKWIINKELVKACRQNDVKTNLFKILSRYPKKAFQQLLMKPKGVP